MVSVIHKSALHLRCNVISSHSIYKINVNDDNSLKRKERIKPHGKDDIIKSEIWPDSSMRSPTIFWILLSISSLLKWRWTKSEVEATFLQTGRDQRDVYFIPPKGSMDKGLQSTWCPEMRNNDKWSTWSLKAMCEADKHDFWRNDIS